MTPPLLMMISILIFTILSSITATAQTTNQTIMVGATISVNDTPRLSPSGHFAFGFRQVRAGDQNSFLLCIWYNKIRDKTIVWYANNGSTLSTTSTVRLTADRGLVMSDKQGQEIRVSVWTTESRISHAVLNDTGNLMLKGADSDLIWESFESPTDTLLPGQNMEIGGLLSSKRSETNFNIGKFQLSLLPDGNLVLNSINLPSDFANEAYYRSETYNQDNSSNSGLRVVFNDSGYMNILIRNGTTVPISDVRLDSADDFYFRTTLDYDGVLAQYRHRKVVAGSNETWSVVWLIPNDICQYIVRFGSGVCGYNSICRLNDDKRPACECPAGYGFIDQNDAFGDCQPVFRLSSCSAEDQPYLANAYVMNQLTNVDWPLSDYQLLNSMTADSCREACVSDCMCVVSVFGESSKCWKKKLPLSNGRVGITVDRTTFVKAGKANSTRKKEPDGPYPDDGKNKNQDEPIIIGSVLLGSSFFVNCLLAAVICFGCYTIHYKVERPASSSVIDTNLRCFTQKELSEATNEFKEELGRGTFGIVYKGKLRSLVTGSEELIAVKKLNGLMENGDKEFKTEVRVIGRTHHKNLVRLLGFCDEGPDRMLVYECMRNGTLANLLFDNTGKLSWTQRIRIALGVARGLAYLHEECDTPIIHCDIKPQNILLDDYYNARISDFGLAKLLMLNQSQTRTGIRGTKGYVAAEWFRNMPITVKVDVYSFGVVLLEIVTCKKNVDMEGTRPEEQAILTDWAHDCYKDGMLAAFVDDSDKDALNDMALVERFVKVALWCIQEDPGLRPTMRKVTQMLEGVVQVDDPPYQCSYGDANITGVSICAGLLGIS